MLVILIRTVLIYLIVLVVIRIMGKSELAKLSAFQMVIIFMIAELAAIPIESPDTSLINGIIAIFTLLFLQVLISLISIKSEKFRCFVTGKPSILIDHGEINHKEMKNLRISINDLTEQLRIANCPSIADVNYAIMESNGAFSVIPNSNKRPLTPSDLAIPVADEIMPLMIISDGVLYEKNLKRLCYDEAWLKGNLQRIGIDSYGKVFIAFCDETRKLHVYCDNQSGKATEVIICDPL